MTDYTKTTDFTSKDSLPSGDSGKIIRGAEFGTEFDNIQTAVNSKSNKENPSFTGNITVTGTVDGRDISADGTKLDTIETSADVTDTANVTAAGAVMDSELTDIAAVKALNQGVATTDSPTFADVTSTGNVTVTGTVDGRDVATDGTKLDTVETNADVTDTTNVTAAGALMDSEVTNLAQVKAFDSADYATAAQGTTADNALPKTGGAMTGAITTNSTFDGRDVATDGTKLDGIEASADVTDTTNVTAAGALMDSELTDLTAIKSLDQGVATTDSPTFAGLTTTADVSFGDNDKAIFGAGSDLLIYHDGSNSYISEAGTGSLRIRSNQIRLEAPDSQNMIIVTEDAGVQAFYNGTQRLEVTNTGIDVTGTVTADGLTVQGASDSTVLVEATGGNDASLFLTEAGTGNVGAQFVYDGGVNELFLKVGNNTDTTRLSVSRDTGDISFYDSSGTSQSLFWDSSAESLGIGTSSPSSALEVNSGTANNVATFKSTDAYALIKFEDSGTSTEMTMGAKDGDMVFRVNASEAMRIDSSGNVKLITANDTAGTSKFLTFGTNSFNRAGIKCTNAATYDGSLEFYTGNASNFAERMRIDSSGNVGIGRTNPSSYVTDATSLYVKGQIRVDGVTNTAALPALTLNDTNSGLFAPAANEIAISTGAAERLRITSGGILEFNDNAVISVNDTADSMYIGGGGTVPNTIQNQASALHNWQIGGSNAMRLDASGNLLVGTTETDVGYTDSGAGCMLAPEGTLQLARSSSNANLYLNKLDNDGEIINFRKDGTTVGSIGTAGGDLTVGTGDTGLTFEDSADVIHPINQGTGGARDNAIDLGKSAARFKNLYLSGGVYLGGTGSANKLDDYEEGSWTPTLNSASFTASGVTSVSGAYVKIGDFVQVSFTISFSGTSGNFAEGDSASIGGLPFNPVTFNGGGTANASQDYLNNVRMTWQTVPANGSDDMVMIIHSGAGTVARSASVTGVAMYSV